MTPSADDRLRPTDDPQSPPTAGTSGWLTAARDPQSPPTAGTAEWLRAMHHGPQPLVLPNVWDPVSARAFAEAGFAAMATSSAAVAATLGYADGQTPGEEMLAAVARIARSVDVPVTVDFENGYGLPPAELADRLLAAGVVGCNLEDSDPASRTLAEPSAQAAYLAGVRAAAGADLVINARVDVFIRPPAGGTRSGATRSGGTRSGGTRSAASRADPDPADLTLADAVRRASAYLAAGADCVYPIIAPPESLPRLVWDIAGPVNAMYQPGGLTLAELAEIGVARITFGSGLHARATHAVREMAGQLAAELAVPGASRPAQRK